MAIKMKVHEAVEKFLGTMDDNDSRKMMWEAAYVFTCSKSGRAKIIEALKNSEHYEEFLEECGIDLNGRG